MSEDQAVDNNPTHSTETVISADATSPGTVEPSNGQAQKTEQGAPAGESFSPIDPKSLPPELQEHYKSLQADYTRKMQANAEALKKAAAYDQITSDQKFTDYWRGLTKDEKAEYKEQKKEVEKQFGSDISDEDFVKAFSSKEEYFKLQERLINQTNVKTQDKINELEKKQQLSQAADIVEDYASAKDGKSGEALRPDFYDLENDQLITGYLSAFPAANATEYAKRVDEAYQWAKSMTAKYYEKGKAEALQSVQKKAAASTEPPSLAAKNGYSGTDPKKLSASEAVALAKKGIRIPQNY